MPQQFAGIHLYILGGDGKCESKQPYTRYMQSTMSSAQTAPSEVHCTDLYATASSVEH